MVYDEKTHKSMIQTLYIIKNIKFFNKNNQWSQNKKYQILGDFSGQNKKNTQTLQFFCHETEAQTRVKNFKAIFKAFTTWQFLIQKFKKLLKITMGNLFLQNSRCYCLLVSVKNLISAQSFFYTFFIMCIGNYQDHFTTETL